MNKYQKIMNKTVKNLRAIEKMGGREMDGKKKLNNNQIKEINNKLGTIVLMREEICEIVNRDCLKCPLSILDKCTELNLGEFDFEENQWLDINYQNGEEE